MPDTWFPALFTFNAKVWEARNEEVYLCDPAVPFFRKVRDHVSKQGGDGK